MIMVNIIKMVHQGVADVISESGFVGDIEVNLLCQDVSEDNFYFGVYYFMYEDEKYHIISLYKDDHLYISLNIEIVGTEIH